MPTPQALSADTRLGRIALTVPSVEAVVPFYRDVVGLVVHERRERRATLGAPDRPILELIADPDAPERTDAQAGLFHLAIRVPTRAALGGALERIENGWRLDGASDHAVSEALYLHDPAGNGIEIYRDRPREEWPMGARGMVAMETSPLAIADLRAASDGTATVPTGTDLGHVHLETTDLAAANQFYVEGLGMNVRADYGADSLFLAAGEYHHHVGLNTWNGRREARAEGAQGLAWYELVVPDASDLGGVLERLRERGVTVENDDGELTAVDPAGITVRLRPAVGVASVDEDTAGSGE